jgi:hypothetical protein
MCGDFQLNGTRHSLIKISIDIVVAAVIQLSNYDNCVRHIYWLINMDKVHNFVDRYTQRSLIDIFFNFTSSPLHIHSFIEQFDYVIRIFRY